jgi:ATP-dependent Lon protease
LSPAALSPAKGLASDYFGEVLLALRDWPYDETWLQVQARWPLLPHLNRRDVTALDRVGRGLFKLVFPDGVVEAEVAMELLALAAESRQRIHEQLMKIEPGEFPPYVIGYQGVSVMKLERMRIETPLDRQINRSPRPGEATAVVAWADPTTGTVSTDVAVVQVVVSSGIRRQGAVLAEPGLVGMDAVWHVAQWFLATQSRTLGLDTTVQWDGLGAQWTGGPGDLRGRSELALIMAVVSAWLKRPLPPATAFIGGLTVAGDVISPPNMVALAMAALNRGRQTIVVPEGSPVDLLRDTFSETFGDIAWVTVGSAFSALDWALGRR